MDIAQLRLRPARLSLSPLNFSELTAERGESADDYAWRDVPRHPEPGDECCPICWEEAADIHAAASCCLWKDIDAPTRTRIANDVEAGASWVEAIARNTTK